MRRRAAAIAAAALLGALGCVAAIAQRVQDGASPAVTAPRERAKARELGPPAKPTAPFAVEHRLLAVPAVGRPVTVELTVRVLAPTTAVEVTVSGTGDLELGRVPVLAAPSLAPGEAPSAELAVTPLAEGRAYLAVLVEGDVGGERQARSVAIAIEVPVAGRAAPRPERPAPAAAPPQPANQAIRSLPAEERVR